MKIAYLIEQCRQRGDADLFLEVNRREAAHMEAAARIVHPTLHLPAACKENPPQQLSTQIQHQHSNNNPRNLILQGSLLLHLHHLTGDCSQGLVGQHLPLLFLALHLVSLLSPPHLDPNLVPLFGSTPAPCGFRSTTSGLTTTPSMGGGSGLFATPSFGTCLIGGADVSGASFDGGAVHLNLLGRNLELQDSSSVQWQISSLKVHFSMHHFCWCFLSFFFFFFLQSGIFPFLGDSANYFF